MSDENATTGWADYHNVTDSLSPEHDVADYLTGGESNWLDRLHEEGPGGRTALQKIYDGYRVAIEAVLPKGLTLAGTWFYCLYDDRDKFDPEEIKEAIRAIDLTSIVDKYDPDRT